MQFRGEFVRAAFLVVLRSHTSILASLAGENRKRRAQLGIRPIVPSTTSPAAGCGFPQIPPCRREIHHEIPNKLPLHLPRHAAYLRVSTWAKALWLGFCRFLPHLRRPLFLRPTSLLQNAACPFRSNHSPQGSASHDPFEQVARCADIEHVQAAKILFDAGSKKTRLRSDKRARHRRANRLRGGLARVAV